MADQGINRRDGLTRARQIEFVAERLIEKATDLLENLNTSFGSPNELPFLVKQAESINESVLGMLKLIDRTSNLDHPVSAEVWAKTILDFSNSVHASLTSIKRLEDKDAIKRTKKKLTTSIESLRELKCAQHKEIVRLEADLVENPDPLDLLSKLRKGLSDIISSIPERALPHSDRVGRVALRFLHFTDLHCGAPGDEWLWPRLQTSDHRFENSWLRLKKLEILR